MIQKKRLSAEEALQKAKHYCGYQHRCHSEVKDKLYSFGLWKNDVEQIVSQLIEEKYLDEERFAIHFASGRFKLKHWGKEKIKNELKQKRVSDYCIKKALGQISDVDYEETLKKLTDDKKEQLKGEKNIFVKKRKLQDYLMQKGFEYDRIKKIIAEENDKK